MAINGVCGWWPRKKKNYGPASNRTEQKNVLIIRSKRLRFSIDNETDQKMENELNLRQTKSIFCYFVAVVETTNSIRSIDVGQG